MKVGFQVGFGSLYGGVIGVCIGTALRGSEAVPIAMLAGLLIGSAGVVALAALMFGRAALPVAAPAEKKAER